MSEIKFYRRYLTLNSHKNTVFCIMFAAATFKMAGYHSLLEWSSVRFYNDCISLTKGRRS